MECKHSMRAGWARNISTHTDKQIMQQVAHNRKNFPRTSYMPAMQVWRQIYEAEARKRGLL